MIKTLMLFIAIFSFSSYSHGQQGSAFDNAYRDAVKVKQSLSLDSSFIKRLHVINMDAYLKKVTGQSYGNNGSLSLAVIGERYRDTAYKAILTDSLFHLYLQRKPTLITTN